MKDVKRDVVGVRPHTDLWIVGDVCAEAVRPHVIRPGRIRRRGYRKTLRELTEETWKQWQRYFTDDPAIGHTVVLNDRIAEAAQLIARAQQSPPEGSIVNGSQDLVALFVEHDERVVDPLDDVVRPHRHVRIRRQRREREP